MSISWRSCSVHEREISRATWSNCYCCFKQSLLIDHVHNNIARYTKTLRVSCQISKPLIRTLRLLWLHGTHLKKQTTLNVIYTIFYGTFNNNNNSTRNNNDGVKSFGMSFKRKCCIYFLDINTIHHKFYKGSVTICFSLYRKTVGIVLQQIIAWFKHVFNQFSVLFMICLCPVLLPP